MYQQDKLKRSDQEKLGQLNWETKTNKIQKLRREIEFLERYAESQNETQ